MPHSLAFEAYLDAIDDAATRMVEAAERAGLEAEVATCPTWDVRALLAHQAMVHRWAAANVRGDDPDQVPNQTELRATILDLPTYLHQGAVDLVTALREAPGDLKAMTFLNDAPPPRMFWARRQTHETTIHMVDACSAALGRVPAGNEVAIDHDLALDGIDELLCGFYTRGRSKLFDGTEYDVLVAPNDSPRRWLMHVAERMIVEPDPPISDAEHAGVRIDGPAAALYLALWNRGDDVTVTGDDGLLQRWHATQRVRWT